MDPTDRGILPVHPDYLTMLEAMQAATLNQKAGGACGKQQTREYQVLPKSLLTFERLSPFVIDQNLETVIPPAQLLQIAIFHERLKAMTAPEQLLVKKDLKTLPLSLFVSGNATHVLLKRKTGEDKIEGSEKSPAFAIRIPNDPNEPISRVCQLTSLDNLTDEQRAQMKQEFELQDKFAAIGIAPKVFEVVDYEKICKDRTIYNKTCAFVEAFTDLKFFDTSQSPNTLNYEQILDTIQAIASHNAALNNMGMVHVDLALENIGINLDPFKVVLFDFGAVRKIDEALATGHCGCIAPEIIRKDKKIDPTKAAVFAIGSMLSMLLPLTKTREAYEPIAQDIQFQLLQKKIVDEHGDAISWNRVLAEQLHYVDFSEQSMAEIDTLTELPAFLKAFVGICLHPDPVRRPSAAQLVTYCERYRLRSRPQNQQQLAKL